MSTKAGELQVALGEVVSFDNFIIVAKSGLHIFEVDNEGGVKKVHEYGLSVIPDVSVLMRGENCVVAYDAENEKAIIYDLENEKKREFFLQLDRHIVRSSCIRGSVLYGTFNDQPVGYSITSGKRVWMSDYKISARTVVASRTAVLYKFIAGAVQGYSLKG